MAGNDSEVEICKSIRSLRMSVPGLTQEEMAKLVGVDRATYANYETRTVPQVHIYRRIKMVIKNKQEEKTVDELRKVFPSLEGFLWGLKTGKYTHARAILKDLDGELADIEKELDSPTTAASS